MQFQRLFCPLNKHIMLPSPVKFELTPTRDLSPIGIKGFRLLLNQIIKNWIFLGDVFMLINFSSCGQIGNDPLIRCQVFFLI